MDSRYHIRSDLQARQDLVRSGFPQLVLHRFAGGYTEDMSAAS
jgi:hypothetical protein